jgi:Flp pilus assembly protein TadG
MRRLKRPLRQSASETGASESGVSVIEVVLLAPLVIGFIMILVCFGVLVDARGNVQGAARDAARMGSLQRDDASAYSAAQQAATSELGSTCTSPPLVQQVDPNTKTPYSPGGGPFAPGELYTIKVSCVVDLKGLNWFGLPTQTVVSYSTAPLDVFRRAG